MRCVVHSSACVRLELYSRLPCNILRSGLLGWPAVQGLTSWLQQHSVVQLVLKSNLHQAQYADQVRLPELIMYLLCLTIWLLSQTLL